MLNAVKRLDIFKNFPEIDNYIADLQLDMSNRLDDDDKTLDLYDHRTAFNRADDQPTGFCAMGWPFLSRTDYALEFPLKLKLFLRSLEIEDLILLHWLKLDLVEDFQFELPLKKEQFKWFGAVNDDSLAYHFKTSNIDEILPLFLFHRNEGFPSHLIFSGNPATFFCMNICDDGNLHLSFKLQDQEEIMVNAGKLGFLVGDPAIICRRISVMYTHVPVER